MLEFVDDIYAETDHNLSKTQAFERFDDCKTFINQQNVKLLNTEEGVPKSDRVVMYQKAIRHGIKLEQKYISFEERKATIPQQTNDEEEFIK